MTDEQLPVRVLGRQEILDAPDAQYQLVEVPEWGGSVWVKGLSGSERDAFEVSLLQGKGKNREVNLRNLRAKLVARSCVADANGGGRLFTETDVTALGGKSAAALNRVFTAAQHISGLTEEDVEELTDSLGEEESADSGSA